MTSTWSTGTNEHKNYTKLCRLLYDGGSEAVRSVFDVHCQPLSLVATLKSYETRLRNLKKPRLNNNQLDKLYPPSGPSPTSKDFDITLLFVLLRNICPGVTPPTTGWNDLPPPGDSSLEANLVRIKFYRNNVIAHRPSAKIDDTLFETYWKEISTPLLSLGIKQDDIDKLKSASLGEVDFNKLLNEWYQSDEDIKSQLAELNSGQKSILSNTVEILEEMKNQREADIKRDSPISKLVCSDFDSVVRSLVKSYHPNTREWVFEEVRSYLEKEQYGSTMVVIEAGPGMGKSVVAAKICDMYKESGDITLGACHFFKHNHKLRNDPRLMLQSIARQLCESVPGYKGALEGNIQAIAETIPQLGCRELFTSLLEPCCKLDRKDTVVVVIDALDECNNMKNELCVAFSEGISRLPSWLRFVITTRPPPSISSFRTDYAINMYIKTDDTRNESDLKVFFNEKLKELGKVSSVDEGHIKDLVDTTEGIFLVAFFVIDYLTTKSGDSLSEIIKHFPKGNGIRSVYEDYLNRLKKALLPYIKSEEGFFHMLDAIVEAKFPIEKKMFYDILGLVDASRVPIPEREEAIHLLHQLFPVENEHVSAFHKTIIDWLTTGDHYFRVKDTKDVIAKQCYEVLTDIKQVFKNHLEEPPKIKSNEFYAMHFGEDYMKSTSFDDAKRVETQSNCFMFCLYGIWYMQRNSECGIRNPYDINNALGVWNSYDNDIIQLGYPNRQYNSVFKPKTDNVIKMQQTFSGMYNLHPFQLQIHESHCRFYHTRKLKDELQPVLQYLHHYQDISNEIQLTPRPIELLKEYGLPYYEGQVIRKAPYDYDTSKTALLNQHFNSIVPDHIVAVPSLSMEILPCDKAFCLVKYPKTADSRGNCTLIQKYQLDGKLVMKERLSGKKKLFMSPDYQFIVAIPVFTKENIEIIDAATLKMHTSYTPPNVIRSCHVYGSQPWYILIRCFNNKIYVMEAETGKIIHQPVDVDQSEKVEAVSNLGHIVLVKDERAPPMYSAGVENVFANEEGTLFEDMIYSANDGTRANYIRKLYLCHFDKSHRLAKMTIYPLKEEQQCDCKEPTLISCGSQSMHFSEDGHLFAFDYKNTITVINTSDGSVYYNVSCGAYSFVHKILSLTKDTIVLYDGRYIFSVNMEIQQMDSDPRIAGLPVNFGNSLHYGSIHIVPGFVGETVAVAFSHHFNALGITKSDRRTRGRKGRFVNDNSRQELFICKYSIYADLNFMTSQV